MALVFWYFYKFNWSSYPLLPVIIKSDKLGIVKYNSPGELFFGNRGGSSPGKSYFTTRQVLHNITTIINPGAVNFFYAAFFVHWQTMNLLKTLQLVLKWLNSKSLPQAMTRWWRDHFFFYHYYSGRLQFQPIAFSLRHILVPFPETGRTQILGQIGFISR